MGFSFTLSLNHAKMKRSNFHRERVGASSGTHRKKYVSGMEWVSNPSRGWVEVEEMERKSPNGGLQDSDGANLTRTA